MMKLFLSGMLGLACALPAAAQLLNAQLPESAPAPAGTVTEAEWSFLNAAGQDKEEDVLELALPQLEDWLARNPEHASAPDAQLLKARLHMTLGEYKYALVDLLKHFQDYPQAASAEGARKFFGEILAKKADKKTRPALEAAAAAPETTASDLNLSMLLEKLVSQAGETYYEPLVAEFRAFFNRFPQFSGNDSLRLTLAELHRQEGKYLASRLAYEKMIQLHPASPLLAKAKLALGGVLADNLKEYDKSITVYQDVAASFPDTNEAWAAYGRLPVLAEKQKKFELAVEIYEKIIALYPDRDEAYNSYKSEARVLREDLDKFPEAVAVLNRVADKYKGAKAIEALLLAAEICRKDMKDTPGELAMYDRIVAEYEADPAAPKALYSAGEVYDKAKDFDKAREYYQKILEKYPDDPLSKKAEKRVAAIIAGKP
ncbi:MAG TPA: hypothetical protein DEQ38_06175 [Elusimicrobia bacterium]|nr:hypothetical protein [Elusimicrobiota bacterium]